MAWPTLTLRIAFSTAPLAATPSWTTVTNDMRNISIKRGRNHNLDRMEAGTMVVEMLNKHGDYWPLNTGGAYYPNVLPGKRIQLYAVYGVTTYYLYTGFIEDWNPDWIERQGGLVPIVQPECADLINNLANYDINDGIGYSQELSGTRVGNVLDDLGWPAADRDLDAGQSTMQATGALADQNAMEHLFKVQQSELGILYIAGDGDVQFEGRHHRLLNHTISLAIFGDDLSENYYHGLEPRFGASDISNDIRITRSGGTQQNATDSTSQTDYGKRSLSRTGLLMTTDNEAKDQADYLLKQNKDAVLRNRSIKLVPERDPGNLWPKILGYDISDRITLRRNEAGIDRDYHIEGIQHEIDLANHTWITKWQLSEADSQIYWVLGVAGFSELGQKTYLAY